MIGGLFGWRWLLALAVLIGWPAGAGLAQHRYAPGVAVVQERLPGLTVRLPGGDERLLTIAELEALGTWRVRTTSPWEDGEITLEGPLLRDVLAHVGIERAESIIVRSADDYAPEIPRADWQDFPVILATRMDGKPLGRRHKGPTRIVYPLSAHPELGSPEHQARWVWLIASIELPG